MTAAATDLPAAADRRASADLLLFAVPAFIWGTTWLAIKHQLGAAAPPLSVGIRFALAALLLGGFCAARRLPLRFTAPQHLSLAALGVLLFGANYVLVYLSEQHLPSGLVAVLFALILFANLAGDRLLFGTPLPPALLLGAALGFAGVALLFWPEVAGFRAGDGAWVGIAEALAATLIASGGNLLSQRLFRSGVPVLPGTAVAMGWAAALVLAGCAVAGVPFAVDPRPDYLASLAYLAVLGSVVAFASFLTLVKRVGAGRAGYVGAVSPVVAMAASTLFEGYRWTAAAAAGLVLVLAGTVLVLRARALARAA